MNPRGLPGCPQDQIIILAAVEIRVESADLLRQFPLEHQKMTDVVFGEQEIRSPIRLKERFETSPQVVNLDFVAIDQVGIWSLVDGFANVREGVRGQGVVVVEEADVI